MKKKISVIILSLVILVCCTVTAFAAVPEIVYESSYSADTGLVSVKVYIKNAVGTQSGDFNVVFDKEMFRYESAEKADGKAMIECGLSVYKDNVCTASFLFADSCTKSDVDSQGNLQIAVFTFKPVAENYDINDFYLNAGSFEYNDMMIQEQINSQGNEEHASDIIQIVVPTAANNNNNDGNNDNDQQNQSSSSQSSSSSGSKWYIYVIFGVIAVGAIAGIAFVAVKNSHNETPQENGSEAGEETAQAEEQKDDDTQIKSSQEADAPEENQENKD